MTLPSSVKELKALITKAGLSSADCFDKADLIKRAEVAVARLRQANAGSKTSYGGFATKIRQTKPNAASIDGVVMILHGFGATNDDFIDFVPQFSSYPSLQSKNLLCVFPQAPLMSGMPSWWDLSSIISAFTQAMTTQNTNAMAAAIRSEPRGLVENRCKLTSLLNEILHEYELKKDNKISVPLLVGGFSQGAMTALDFSLSLPNDLIFSKTVNLMMLSGAPIVVDKCHEKLTQLTSDDHRVNVLMTHGKSDFVIPFIANSWSEQMFSQFKERGVNLKNVVHAGAHDLGGQHVLNEIFGFVGSSIESS